MKCIPFFFSIFLAPLLALAAPTHYTITAKVFIDGKLIGSPRMTVNQGEPAEITSASENPHNELKVKIVASESTEDGVAMRLEVENKSESGTIQAHPEIVAKLGSETSITPTTNSNYPNAKMKIKLLVSRD
jgi:ribosomal protein S4